MVLFRPVHIINHEFDWPLSAIFQTTTTSTDTCRYHHGVLNRILYLRWKKLIKIIFDPFPAEFPVSKTMKSLSVCRLTRRNQISCVCLDQLWLRFFSHVFLCFQNWQPPHFPTSYLQVCVELFAGRLKSQNGSQTRRTPILERVQGHYGRTGGPFRSNGCGHAFLVRHPRSLQSSRWSACWLIKLIRLSI